MSDTSQEPPRIYLDNAATSWPKPESVYQAVDRYQRELGAPAGRSGYAEAAEVARMVESTRASLASLFNLEHSRQLIFTFNGTDALNLVLHGLLKPGDHVVATVLEHNSVIRPLETLASAGDSPISSCHVPCDAAGLIDPAAIAKALRPNTRLVAISHASNVTGAIQPVREIAALARARGIRVLCDAAQTAGHLPVDLQDLGVDYLAASGHKGLLGPLGTGVLAIRRGAEVELSSVRQGGTGTQSETIEQPDTLPFKFESGNLNVAGIVGLGAGVAYLHKRGLAAIQRHGRTLTEQLLAGLSQIPGLTIHGPSTSRERVPLVSISLAGYDPQEVALSLDAGFRIQVRPGLHCAPLMHRALGTIDRGGTVRFSLGAFTTAEEIDAAVLALAEIAGAELQGT